MKWTRAWTLYLLLGSLMTPLMVFGQDTAPEEAIEDTATPTDEAATTELIQPPIERVNPPREASSFDLEQRYRDLLPAEQFVQLEANGEPFAALWLEQETSNPQGAVLILHDDGHHQDWPHLVQDLRQYLPAVGWATLSIALPPEPRPRIPPRTLNTEEPIPGSAVGSEPDAAHLPTLDARTEQGVRELMRRGYLNVVVLGLGSGVHPAARYMVNIAPNAEGLGFGLVMIDARPQDTSLLMPLFGELTTPTLDLYTHRDTPFEQAARQRRAAVQRANQATFVQVRDISSSTTYRSSPQVVTRRVWGWLRTNMAGRETDVIINE
ncbi:DUF3530 family protein [Salinispirillum marinum]|uniref:DUF3530 family protein n=2 Tax=Saccharospirillaceae TaxID=255527 RepID=A0ABV8BC01_9GAMM